MPAPFKMKSVAVIVSSLRRRRKLGRFGSSSLLAVMVLVPAALAASAWHIAGPSLDQGGSAQMAAHSQPIHSALLNLGPHALALRASAPRSSSWAGGLEPTQSEKRSSAAREPKQPITSASYTSGFDKKVAGLDPLPRAQSSASLAQARDPRACPRDLNCSFRSMKVVAVSAPPLHQRAAPVDPEIAKAKKPETGGFSLFAAHLRLPSPPHLPSANILLKPFTFVGTTFAHFVKKM